MMSEKFNCPRSISILHMCSPYLFLISKLTFPPEYPSRKRAIIIWTAELIFASFSTSINLTSFLFLLKIDPQNLAFLLYHLFFHAAGLHMKILLSESPKSWFSSFPSLHPCCVCFSSGVNLLLSA